VPYWQFSGYKGHEGITTNTKHLIISKDAGRGLLCL